MKEFIIGIAAALTMSVVAAATASEQTAHSLQFAQLKSADAQSIEKLDMSAVPDLDRSTVRRVQGALRAKGFDPGPLNGVAGEKTKAAVQKFQDRFGIKDTGIINNQTLFALGVVGDKPAAVEEESQPKQERNKSLRNSKSPQKSIPRGAAASGRSRSLWCAEYARDGGRNCGFYTFEQCRAAISGVGGNCYQQ